MKRKYSDLVSKNPFSGIINAVFTQDSDEEIEKKLLRAEKSFLFWRQTSYDLRNNLLNKLSEVLIRNKNELAEYTVREVGQPIKQSIAEIEKCALTAQYYEGKIHNFLRNEVIERKSSEVYVSYEPLGIVLGIVPWNYPFWMAFRFIIPTLSAGNVVILKHASNVPLCAKSIEKVILDAGFPEGVFQTLMISSDRVEKLVRDPKISAISFSGSVKGGSSVASLAGKEIKKTVLELGGSDAFVVMKDADIGLASKNLVEGRMRNSGQACNSPKRCFVHKDLIDEFLKLVLDRVKLIRIGDPMDLKTEIGPIATDQGIKDLIEQINDSIDKGANLLYGGKINDDFGKQFFEPTVLTNVKKGMKVFDEEVFGPVICISKYESNEDLINLVNSSDYGLGASIWTSDVLNAKNLIPYINTGNVFINQQVRSDPRLPYGGVKKSGYGRELSYFGIKEFTNIKSVVINKI